jgi:hypothetical protein
MWIKLINRFQENVLYGITDILYVCQMCENCFFL